MIPVAGSTRALFRRRRPAAMLKSLLPVRGFSVIAGEEHEGKQPAAPTYFGSIDQGTSSTRFIIFDENLEAVSSHQVELKHNSTHPGWADMDPLAVLSSVQACAEGALAKANLRSEDLKAVGVANQRETAIAWDKLTGEPLAPALLWFDDRAKPICDRILEGVAGSSGDDAACVYKEKTGLRIDSYFSAFKMRWLLENNPDVQAARADGSLALGTMESFLIFHLTGGERHVTDVTNAHRTMLMNLHTLDWDPELCEVLLGVDSTEASSLLPESILPNAHPTGFGVIQEGVLKGVPICGALGDQQSALVGQRCFEKGNLKSTFGSSNVLLMNCGEGEGVVYSDDGLLTTVGYQMGPNTPPAYALEGVVAVSGLGLRWMSENLRIAENPKEVVDIASSVTSSKGLYFVPAFSGLFGPYWDAEARGIMMGLTGYHTREHVARAMVDAVCFQCKDVMDAMPVPPSMLKVDGGLANSDFVMQLLADVTQTTVEKPSNVESTALGAAIAAGVGCGHWESVHSLGKDNTDPQPCLHLQQAEATVTSRPRLFTERRATAAAAPSLPPSSVPRPRVAHSSPLTTTATSLCSPESSAGTLTQSSTFFEPEQDAAGAIARRHKKWKDAVSRCMGWQHDDEDGDGNDDAEDDDDSDIDE